MSTDQVTSVTSEIPGVHVQNAKPLPHGVSFIDKRGAWLQIKLPHGQVLQHVGSDHASVSLHVHLGQQNLSLRQVIGRVAWALEMASEYLDQIEREVS